MRRALWLAVVAGATIFACSPGSAAAPGVTPLPASPVPVQPAPGQAILDAAAVGLPVTGTADGITAAEAANDVPDAADALPLFDSWGWVVASRRSFGRGGVSVEVTVLLLLRTAGAASAFTFYSEQAAVPPLVAAVCPAAAGGADECALGQGGGRTLVVGRVGAEVFTVSATGADAIRLASLQASRLRD
jgi:hypothetical protein